MFILQLKLFFQGGPVPPPPIDTELLYYYLLVQIFMITVLVTPELYVQCSFLGQFWM